MDPVAGAHRGFFCILIILSSGALLVSGIFLPRLHTPGSKFWKRDVPQYPALEDNMDLKAALVPSGPHVPSITLQDWSLKWMSSDVTAPQDDDNSDEKQNKKSHLWGSAREEAPHAGSQRGTVDLAGWAPGWQKKRRMVVADDAAFREKSKLLTTMERQKWLEAYMQKVFGGQL